MNAVAQQATNAQNRAWDLYWYNRQRKDSLADWTRQNDYNSPQAQMQRLQQAGLNPNLVYGHGADAQSTAPVKSSSVGTTQNRPVQFDAGSIMGSYFDTEVKQAQVDNLKAQNNVLIQDSILKAAQVIGTTASTEKTKADTASTQFDTALKNDLRQYSLEAAKAGVQKTMADTKSTLDENERRAALQSTNLETAVENILNMRANRLNTKAATDEARQRIENLKKDGTLKDLDIALQKLGIQKTDPLWQRAAARVINAASSELQDLKKDPMGTLNKWLFGSGKDGDHGTINNWLNKTFNR